MTLNKTLQSGTFAALWMLLGGVFIFLREIFLAAQFGVGNPDANIAIALFLIPDFIISLLIGSSLSSVLIPAFSRMDKERAPAFLWQCIKLVVPVFTLIAIGTGFIAGSSFISIALFSLPLTAAALLLSAYLEQRGKILAPGFSNIIFNVVIIGALWFLPAELIMLSFMVVFASLARLGVSFIAFLSSRYERQKSSEKKNEADKLFMAAYAQNMLSNMLGIFILYTPFAMIAFLSPSEFALFNYSFKLIIFPSLVLQAIIQMYLRPWFVNIRARSNAVAPREYSYSLKVAWVASLSVALCVSLVSNDIAQICFGYGKMALRDTRQIGELLAIGIWSAPCIVMILVWQQLFYAYHKQKAAWFSNIALALFVMPLCWVGYIMGDSEGLLYGFVGAQLIPFFILALTGKIFLFKASASILNSAVIYFKMSLAVLFAFIPFAFIYDSAFLNEYENILLAVMIAAACTFAGLYIDKTIRKEIHKAIANKYIAGM